MISSFNPVPPSVTMTFTFICLLNSLQIWDVCNASSLVGTNTRAAKQIKNYSQLSNIKVENVNCKLALQIHASIPKYLLIMHLIATRNSFEE